MGMLYQPWLMDKCISEMIGDWKTKVFGKNFYQCHLSTQVSYELTWDQTQACMVKSQQLTTAKYSKGEDHPTTGQGGPRGSG
jgi:hypothetical protein